MNEETGKKNRIYYIAKQLNFMDQMNIVLDTGTQKITYPLDKIVNSNATGIIFVYESLEDLRRDYPDAEYMTVELNLPEGGTNEGI